VRYGINHQKHQDFWCKTCKRRFQDNGHFPRGRFSIEIIVYAQIKRSQGITFRGIARDVKQHFGKTVSDVSIISWCTQPQFKTLSPTCQHYWVIDTPSGGQTSQGSCQYCGAKKQFLNYIPEEYESMVEADQRKKREHLAANS
jgi:hypothetical protein